MLGARVYVRAGKPEGAEPLLKRAIDVNSERLEPYAMLGQIYTVQNKLESARAAFESVVQRKPDSVSANTVIGVLHEMQGHRAEARKQYERVLKIDASAPVAANNLAYIYAEDGGNLDVALQLAQAAKQKLPELAEVTDTLGWVYYKKELPGLAIPMFEQAVAKAPGNPVFRYHLGLALLKNGERAKARTALELVLKNSPNAPEAAEARKAIASM